MNDFDKFIKSNIDNEKDVPNSVKIQIEQTLLDLPENTSSKKQIKLFPRLAAAVACFVFITMLLLPNISVVYAEALEEIPVIGDIIKVVTIRNYFYSNNNYEMNIDVPKVESQSGEATDFINKDINELTTALVTRFYEDLEIMGNEGHGSIYLDYETVTNTDDWFTLKIRVHEVAGSSNTYYKYYHINKKTGKIVQLGDMLLNDNSYDALNKEIQKQMRQAMKNDSNIVYWTDDSIIGKDIVAVSPEHNFYWNSNGELVIPFDKYEVAPGYMGTPEFVISRDILKAIIKTEYYEISF